MGFGRFDRGLKLYERIGAIGASTALVIAAILAVKHYGAHHEVRLWFLIVVAMFVAAVAFLVGFLWRRPVVVASDAVVAARLAELEQAFAESEYGKRLLRDVLESIQTSIASEDDWQLDQLVERGVLGPVRGLLIRAANEDVRLAVLMPRNEGPDRWRMRWTAGHRHESVRAYNQEIDSTMAGLAYRRGELVKSEDVRADERFQANPRETRPFRSLVAIPLQVEDRVVGALSVVSTREGAFAARDISFIQVVAAVVDVLLADEHDILRIERELGVLRAALEAQEHPERG